MSVNNDQSARLGNMTNMGMQIGITVQCAQSLFSSN